MMDVQSGRHVFGMRRTSSQIHSFSQHRYHGAYKELPPPNGTYPYRLDLATVLGQETVDKIAAAGKLVFHTVGDTGNWSYGAEAQDSVAEHMERQTEQGAEADRPAFFYHLGDVVYLYGEEKYYADQFYEPYIQYLPPIFAIAGNHDGDTFVGGNPSLQAFMENLCAAQPAHTWMAGHSNRTTMTQPNVYWTLKTPLATIIGLYSNVTGELDKGNRDQEDWLTAELTAAKEEKCVLVAVHHPPYSLDDTHGGHKPIEDSLDRAFAASGKTPTAVLTGHVHNYQRFMRAVNGREVPYLVAGAGGYAGYTRLHQLKREAAPPAGVTLAAHNTELPGFLTITVTKNALRGEYFVVPPPPGHLTGPARSVDQFTVSLK